MNDKRTFPRVNPVGLALAAACLVTLTGCVGYVDGPRAEVDTTFVAQDDYVYYPQYECYYSVSRHQYAYRDGNAWVARPEPRHVSADVLMRSPSVNMNFHDSPANHHAEVSRQYPKNWRGSDSNQGHPREHDQHDHQGGNEGR